MAKNELICFQIITYVGMARSCYIEAIDAAELGDYTRAETKITDGEAFFLEGHRAHAKLIQEEASKKGDEVTLLLVHAEDQLMTAEVFKILAEKLIALNKKIDTK